MPRTVIRKLKKWLIALFPKQSINVEKRAAEMENIERFNVLAGATLGLLYESFPVPRDLDLSQDYKCEAVVSKAMRRVVLSRQEEDEANFIYATVRWLQQAGYITFAEERRFPLGFRGGILTAKGLEALQAIPDAINPDKKSAGQILAEHIKTGTGDYVRETVKAVLAAGVKMAIGS